MTKMTKIKSTFWDNGYYFSDNFSDHCFRIEIQFDGELDMDVLPEAFNKTIDLVPTIKSKWVTGWFNNHWEIIKNFDSRDYITVTDDIAIAENFMTGKIDMETGAQIKVLIYKHDGKDNMRILFNHMLFDGASMKDFFRLLSRYYSGLKQNREFTVTDFINGDRDFWQLFKNFSIKQRIKFVFRIQDTGNKGRLGFPYEKDAPARNIIFLRNFYDERFFLKLKEKSKKSGVKLNDVIMAAYGRAMFDICPDSSLPLRINCSYDLRKYLKDGKTAGLTNLVSGILIPFDRVEGENFEETVLRIHELTDQFKNNDTALNGLEFTRLASFALRLPVIKNRVGKIMFDGILTGLSNIGSVTEDMVNYTGLNAENFFITGAIINPPCIMLSIFTFRERLYISIAVVGSKKDAETGKRQLDLIRSYLTSYIEE